MAPTRKKINTYDSFRSCLDGNIVDDMVRKR